MNNIITKLKSGRIHNLITVLQDQFNTKSMSNIPTQYKLDVLCCALGLCYDELDSLIADNSPVFRTIKGHCFEVALEKVLAKNGISSKDIGGDGDVDLVVNGHNLQLKTPNMAGTTDFVCQYKTHKTHGAKSEDESMDYYHKVDDFAEFFVGLISYDPFEVFIIPKEKLPRHHLDDSYIVSPFTISKKKGYDLDMSEYVNAFNLIGISMNNIDVSSIVNGQNEMLPKTSQKLGLTTDIVLNTILREENFRIWDMSIRGFAREVVIKRFLKNIGVKCSDEPQKYRMERGEKADLAVVRKSDTIFLQVKGISTTKCKFSGMDSIIATETQLTRGRVNDHPTQSRLYMCSDFDYLLLAIDPPVSYMIFDKPEWSVFIIPTDELDRHNIYSRRLSSLQKFTASELLKYDITKFKSLLL